MFRLRRELCQLHLQLQLLLLLLLLQPNLNHARDAAQTWNVSDGDPAQHPTSHIHFIPGDHEPRIYLAAPSGVSVTQVLAVDGRNQQLKPQYRIQESNKQYFHINEQTGEIKTRRYIDQPVESTYDIIVVAFSQGESNHHQLTIRVTEYNKYPPVFQMSNYLFDVDIMTPPGNVVCKVHARDRDIQSYNSEVYYAFHQPHPLLTINRTSGEIILKEKLSRLTREIPVNLVAVDGGSPRRAGRSKLIISIKILSAPEEVTVVETGDKWALICWKTPRSGVPLGYMLHLLSTKNPDSNSTVSSMSTMSHHNISINELGQRGGKICTALTNLDTKSTIEVQVSGWNEEEKGMISFPVSVSTNVNNCQVNPCKHGICFVSDSSSVGFICDCSPGYAGKLCDSHNLCYPNPCHNLGSCISINSSNYSCTCLPGFYGQDCELFNPCLGIQSPCQNGATCYSNSSNTYNCNCPEGYYGDSCENFNPCSRPPCQHGSLCSNVSNSNYKCNCVPGYTGTHCEKDINECESSPCNNGSSCIDSLNSFVCSCPTGLKGRYCEINVDECKSLPCQNGGTCIDGIGSFKCHCARGYEGLTCESNIDECLSNPCDNNATCIDGIDDYNCICEAGFEGDYCEEEIDECMKRPCVNGGKCRDALNDFECLCLAGFSGKLCEIDLDLCESNPCLHGGTCNDNKDHFSCSCLQGYHGRMCDSKEQCPNQMVKTDRGTFMWSAVDHGILSRIRCPYGLDEHYAAKSIQFFKQAGQNIFDKTGSSFSLKSLHYNLQESSHTKKTQVDIFNKTILSWHFDKDGHSYALRMCLQIENGSVQWGPVMDSVCRNEGFTQAAELSYRLEELTKDPFLIDTKMFLDTSKELLNVVDYALSDQQIAQSMVSIISNMMEVNESVLEEGDKNGTVSQGLVQLIDTYTSKAKIKSKENISIKSSNIALEVNEVDAEESNTTQGIPFSPMHLSKANQSKLQNQALDVAMKVPMQAVTEALKTSRVARVQFVSYRNSKFFRPISIYKGISNLTNDGFIFNMSQTVITATISNTTIENLTELLVYNIPNVYGKQKQSCVYWDPYTLEWLQDGLSTNQTDEKITCESTHLTAFSILLDADPSYNLPEEHKEALSIISYIGSIFSIFGLLLTIITYSLFRCLNRDRPGKILLNLCLSLLLMNLSFLLITIKDSVSIVNVCMAVAMLTHYFVLTSLSWMLVEAVNMYQLLITVFATSETNIMIKRILCAWGIPLVIVTSTAVYDVGFYYSSQSDYCLVSRKRAYIYYISYFGPSCFILGVNCVVFILVSCVLCQKSTTGKVGGQVEKGITIAQVRGAFTVMTLLGVTWVFGSFTIGEAKLVFHYIFCIANSLQGFIIFIVRCVQYPEARIAWMTLIRTGKLKKHRGGIPSSSTGNSNSRNTVSSGTYSQSTRNLSLDTNSGSNTSLWNRFRTRENRNKQRTSRYSTWGLRNVFWSSKENANDTKIFPRTTELRKNDIKGNIDVTPISETLKRELEKSFLNRPTISRTQSMHVKGYMSADTCSSFKRVGSLMCANNGRHSGEQYSNTTGSQESLTTKEGEDTSWQFLRAPSDGIKLKRIPFNEDTFQIEPPVSVQKNTGTHPEKTYYKAISHSDQGYMSGIGTAEHSPESPRQKSRQISKPLLETDLRLTVSTPDNLCTTMEDFKDDSEMNIQQKEVLGISAKSDGEIIHQGKDVERFDDMVPSHTFVVINGQKIYTNNPSVRLNLEQMLSGTEIDIECVDHCQLHKNCSNMNFPSRKFFNNTSHPQKILSSSENVISSSPCDSFLADASLNRLTRVQPHKRV